jgi:hypothetical protein
MNDLLNIYDFIWIFNPWEVRYSKDVNKWFTIWKIWNESFLLRDNERIIDLNKFDLDYLNLSENWENYIIKWYIDNLIYINWKETLKIWSNSELIFCKIDNLLNWKIVYKESDKYIIIFNWIIINDFRLDEWLIFKSIINVCKDNNVYIFVNKKDSEWKDLFWISINWAQPKYLFNLFQSLWWFTKELSN